MARRRKSSKSDGLLGALFIFGVASVFVYRFVETHFAEIAMVAGCIGAVWLVAHLARWRWKNVGSSSASAVDATPPDLSPASLSNQRSKPSAVISFRPEKDPDPMVRITPIVDPPKSELAPTKSWFRKDSSEAKVGNARWVRPGETVAIQGIEIPSGWFYLGTQMRADYSRTEDCLINPKLPIANSGEKLLENGSYNSSYSAFTPSQRRAFLEWMADGRRKSDVGTPVVRVFLDGLEYRVFKQGIRSEVPQLVDEAVRILDLYGTTASFSLNAIRFVSYASALLPNPKRPDPRFAKVTGFISFDELSPHVRVFIGNKLVKGQRITAEDALVWAVALPNVWLRTPATRCREEFETLWSIRFNDQYPDGFAVQPPKTRISLSYPVEYGVSRTPLHGDFEKLPDIASDTGSALKLRELIEACTNELDAYSRFLGRHQELTAAPRASLFLPEDIWLRRYEHSIETMAAVLGDEDLVVAKLGELMADVEFHLDGASSKELAAVLDRFASALRRLDVGVEPKGSHVEAVLSAKFPISLFKIHVRADGGAEDDRAAWRTAVDVALLGVAAAGSLTDAARIAASESIATDFPGLHPMRIWAYAAAVEPVGNRLAKVLKAVGDLPIVERQSIARCAVSTALSGGSVSRRP